jgi:3'-phosphoadenosine 5'-phosphosulfate sulfotransferase (PAPS reductase)/FAD synthetase
MLLAKEVHEERGLGPVRVIFRDEEMVSPLVIDYVERVRNYPWVNMEWYCLPYGAEVWVLGRRQSTVLWSAQREREGRWVRPMPAFAINANHFGLNHEMPLSESVDYYTMQGKKGRVAFLTGVRANESMIRYRSCVQKLHENYIVTPYKMKRGIPLRFAKVIYDWQTDDVFKFIVEEHGAEYCGYYDIATMTGSNTRVGIPLHAVAIRRIGDVVATEPEFYDRLVEVYPRIDSQRRMWQDFDVDSLIGRYSKSGFDGASRFIDDYIIGESRQRRARAYVSHFRQKHAKDPQSYPTHWLIRNLLLNEFTVVSASPSGPGTKAHAVSIKENNYEG